MSDQRRVEVISATRALARTYAATEEQSALLEAVLGALRPDDRWALLSSTAVLLPLDVHASVRGDEAPALPLAAAMTMVDLGIHILDDIADGDMPPHWRGYSPAQVSLAATGLLCSLPYLVIADLDAPPETRLAMQRTLAAGLARIGAGQQRDLALVDVDEVGLAEILACAEAKSGQRRATYAALAAQLAGADQATIAAYVDFGLALGTAAQLDSDCHDLFAAGWSYDLGRGGRTLPVVLYLGALRGPERARFLELLDGARTDAGDQARVRELLRAGRVIEPCGFLIELHCQRAADALERAAPRDPGGAALRRLIEERSPSRRAAEEPVSAGA